MVDTLALYRETKNLSVLFVEDHLPLRERTVEVLKEYFNCVDAAENGLQGFQRYKEYYNRTQQYYDLVISDIHMPLMDGIELTAELYNMNENQPIIILSAHQESEYLLALINFGVARFITKPIQNEEMLDVLYRVCKKINTKVPTEVPSHIIQIDSETTWDKKSLTLRNNDTVITLTRHERLFLELMAEKFELVCSTDEILNHFFMYDADIRPENIRNLAARLRKKLPDGAITSVYGLGYALSSPS